MQTGSEIPADLPETPRSESGQDLAANARLHATLRSLREGDGGTWSMDDFAQYLEIYKRHGEKTRRSYCSQLDFMARHEKAPVTLHGSRADLVESFSRYVVVRERVEGVSPSTLKGDHQAVRALGSFLGIPENVWPARPRPPRTEGRKLPSPEDVHALLHAPFGPRRSYETPLVRYMLVYSFGIGIRPPSELLTASVNDIDLEHGTIIIEEAKKGGSRRELAIQPQWLWKSKNALSLRSWIEGPRKKCNPQTDALFPNADGLPFPSKEALSRFLVRRVCGDKRRQWRCWDGDTPRAQPRFPWYKPYISRHWSCNARLIDTAKTTAYGREYDWNAVARWHGHESVKMTMDTYARAVEVNELRHGQNWLKRAFGRP